MNRVHLTVATSYVPDWGTQEGLRELIQNWMDAETESGKAGRISCRRGTLRLTNPGITLDRGALLMGSTTKAGRADQRGQHGEGLKVGALALLRAGHSVTIETGGDIWRGVLAEHPVLGAEVVAFDIDEGAAPQSKAVVVRVGGVSKDAYATARGRFRRFKGGDSLKAWEGSLLLTPEMRGRIYVKGIWVCDNTDLRYGYDFARVDVDRDRRLVGGWDLKSNATSLVIEAHRRGTIDTPTLYSMAAADAADVGNLYYRLSKSDSVTAALVAHFRSIHGDDAIPVKDEATRNELAHAGLRGVVLPEPLRQTLEQVTGTAKDALTDARRLPTETHGVDSLSMSERDAYWWAHNEIGAVLGRAIAPATVATFRDDGTLGMWASGVILLARHVLRCRYLTIRVLIHEVAHHVGADGEVGHERAQGDLWMRLAARWHGEGIAEVAA